ncbi:winged helix-turn-helix transcriptional regulator [Devosia beringensis]|uniref:winged helix-turn-helix transcriptional regulator n=1 Tax=Devosia beringensis TaxID=2657486 RepID=UPI00186B9B2E|nr:helix-turn-helix domain-containing protein [Devosia beringensis]
METPYTPTKQPKTFAECSHVAVPMIEILGRISGRWSLYIIMSLMSGPMRFSELKRQVEGISQKMLTQTLRELEEDGIVHRTVTPIIPPRVDYELTEMGRELQAPLAAISDWTHRNGDRVAEARDRYAIRRKAA